MKKKTKGWLDEFEMPEAQNGIEGTMGGLTNIPFRYNGAWGGPSMQMGGNIQPPMAGAVQTVPMYQDGGTFDESSFQKFFKTLPFNLRKDDPNYNIRGYWDALGRPESFDYTQPKEEDGYYHAFSRNPQTGEILKSPLHPTFKMAIEEDRKAGYFPIVTPEGKVKTVSGRDFAQGGSLPGSVGFTYARTGSTPSEGPYAKKTLPSAEDGMSFYQHGLDWTPRNISRDGSEVPKNQLGKYTLPRTATESTAVRMFDPMSGRMVNTATTGMTEEEMKESSKSMGKIQKQDRVEKEQRVKERKQAKAAIDKGQPFTLPTGEAKRYEDMTAREKMYTSGKALEARGRINEDDESWIDTFNPVSYLTDIAGGLGTAPLEAKLYDSNLPYVGAIADPLIQGMFGFDPLGSALKVPGKVAKSMESGLLSKTYKLNPWAFKPNSEAYYRRIGGNEGLQDLIETGVVRSKPSGHFDLEEPYFMKGFPLDAGRTGPKRFNYPGPYMVEAKGIPFEKSANSVSQPVSTISISDPGLKIYKEDWLRGYKEVPKKEEGGGVIKDDRGQWAHPGEITEIGSNRITMQGVPYPVLGISDHGDVKMMLPEQEYKFKGNKVTEIPMAQKGKTVSPIYVSNPNDPRLKAYQDSLSLHNLGVSRIKTLEDYGKRNNLEIVNSSFKFLPREHETIAPVGAKDFLYDEIKKLKPEKKAEVENLLEKLTNNKFFGQVPIYKKPAQSVIYEENKGLPKLPFMSAETIPYSTNPKQVGIQGFNFQIPENKWQYRVEYEEDGKPMHRLFPSQSIGESFQKLVPGNRTGYWQKMEDGGEISQAQFGCVGENCRGKSWRPTLSDKSGGGGGDMASVGGEPVTAEELTRSGYESMDKKKVKQYAKDLQSDFPGLTADDVARAAGDSARIRAKLHNFAKQDELIGKYNEALKQGQGINEAHKYFPYSDYFYGYYRPMIMTNPVTGQPIPPTVPQILSAHASPEEYKKTIGKNYKKKNGGWLDEL